VPVGRHRAMLEQNLIDIQAATRYCLQNAPLLRCDRVCVWLRTLARATVACSFDHCWCWLLVGVRMLQVLEIGGCIFVERSGSSVGTLSTFPKC
jgi:hypothetical protein